MDEPKTRFSPEQETTASEGGLAEYGEVSKLAVVSGVVSVLSLGTLLWTPFILVSVVGLVLAMIAALAIRFSAVRQLGSAVVTVALALTSFSAVFGLARLRAYDQLLFNQTRVQSEQWLNQIRDGELDAAFQARIPQMARRQQDQTWEEYYANNATARDGRTQFYQTSPFKELREHGRRGKLRLVENVSIESLGADEHVVTQRFEFTYSDRGQTHTLSLQLAFKRRYIERFRQCHWEWNTEIPVLAPEAAPRSDR